ncbi:hypothetical protein H0H93_012330, partial [Arthromyces matolae]
IKEPKKTGSVRGVDDLVLFDLMVHSLDKSGGLGDRGAAGIQDFGAEHVCNTICKSLKLPKVASVIRLPKNIEPLSPPIYVQIGRGFQPTPGDEGFEDMDSLQPPSGGVDTSKNEKVLQFRNESFEWGPFKVHPATLSRSEKEDGAQKILVLSLHALKLSPADADGHSHSEVMRYVAASSIAGDFFEDLEKSTDTDADYACFEIVSLRIALRCASNLVQIPKSKIADLNAWTFIDDFRDNDSGALGSGDQSPLMNATLDAWCHYIYDKYKSEFLLSNFSYYSQSKPNGDANDTHFTVTHFKTHTQKQDSYTNEDGGSGAIEEFVDAHTCNGICARLGLNTIAKSTAT